MRPVTRFPTRAGGAADRVAGFIDVLRLNGWRLGVQETARAMEAMSCVAVTDIDQVQLALRAVCAGDRAQAEAFDAAFDAYWRYGGRSKEGPKGGGVSAGQSGGARGKDIRDLAREGQQDGPDGDHPEAAASEGDGRLIAVSTRNLQRVDLRKVVTPEDIAEAEAIATRIARAMRDRRTRRRRVSPRGTIDMRRTVRRAIGTGGEPFRLAMKARAEPPARFVGILDVSGSMAPYARVFLSFLRGLSGTDLQTDTYLFHTRLVRITEAMRDPDPLRAVTRLSLMADGFGGGTQIAGALASFNRHYAAGRVNGRTVTCILSDGYDTDPPEALSRELERLRKRGGRVVWLNPLAGWRDYEPVAAGMRAALPYLDLFAPAGTLADLAKLEAEVSRL